MADNIKSREVIRKIHLDDRCVYFVQALLEDTGIVAVSLGGKGFLTIFYDKLMEDEVNLYISEIIKFCSVENFNEKEYNNFQKGDDMR